MKFIGGGRTVNDIIVPTASTKVTVPGCLHHYFHTSSQQLLNSTSSDTDVLWPPPLTTAGSYAILCAA